MKTASSGDDHIYKAIFPSTVHENSPGYIGKSRINDTKEDSTYASIYAISRRIGIVHAWILSITDRIVYIIAQSSVVTETMWEHVSHFTSEGSEAIPDANCDQDRKTRKMSCHVKG